MPATVEITEVVYTVEITGGDPAVVQVIGGEDEVTVVETATPGPAGSQGPQGEQGVPGQDGSVVGVEGATISGGAF